MRMVEIYVQRTWLKTIGDVADLFLTIDHEGEYVSFLGGKVEVNYPFVEAQFARRDVTETDEVFLPAKIPAAVISGIFDLTEGGESKYGFQQHKKRERLDPP
jgi:hypothetical protein